MRKIFLVMDYACNNACISCAQKLEEEGRQSMEQIIEKIDIVNPSKEDYIELSGGEPTLRKDIIDICKYIKENYDTNLILLSNGRKFNDLSFARRIKDTGIDRIMTTLYSPYQKEHDYITQREGSFMETVSGLKNLESIGMNLSVKTIVLQQNYQQLPEFVQFAYKTFPTAWVSIHGLIMRGYAAKNKVQIAATYKDVSPYLEQALDIAIGKGKNLGVFIIPSCTIDPFYWPYLSVNWMNITKTMVYISPKETVLGNMDATPPEYCKSCGISNNCSWAI